MSLGQPENANVCYQKYCPSVKVIDKEFRKGRTDFIKTTINNVNKTEKKLETVLSKQKTNKINSLYIKYNTKHRKVDKQNA